MIPEHKCGLDNETQLKLLHIFGKSKKIKKVLLYGSRAKGNYKNGSDIDLTIDAKSMTLSELLQIENEIDDLFLPYKIDLSLLHLINNPEFIDHIKRVGIDFYSQ